jgi:DNA-nicking Smr family endonuclease
MRLDLHGVKHEDVVRQVDMFIWECMQSGISQATIVTGNSDPMKQIVIGCLNEHGLQSHPFFNIGGSITFDL